MKNLALAFGVVLFAPLFLAFAPANAAEMSQLADRDPMGETAFYRVERNASRTSSMIRSGEITTDVTAYNPLDADGPSYNVNIDYVMSIQILGTQRGTKVISVPEEYFTPAFMEDLRANGTYEGSSFKVRHLGYGDARNMDGAVYTNCDKVLIYDIENYQASPLIALASSMFAGELENMQITAHIKAGVPVLGAVKIDLSGTYSGRAVKAGADYEAP